MNKIVYLEPDEEITSVIDKLRTAEESLVALVIPRGSSLGQSIVNLKLLKKSSEGLGKDISLVATDRITRNLASQIGLTVYSKVREAEKVTTNTLAEIPIETAEASNYKINRYEKEDEEEEEAEESSELENESTEEIATEEEAEPEPKAEKIDRVKEFNTRKISADSGSGTPPSKKTNLGGSRKLLLIIGGAIVLIGLISSYFFLPYASASVKVKTEEYKTELNLNINKSVTEVAEADLVIPAKPTEVTKELAKNFKTTGKRDAGEKAKGSVTFYNDTLDPGSQTVPANTKLTTSDGKVFILVAAVTIPAPTVVQSSCKPDGGIIKCDTVPGTVEGQATASANGDQYNIAPTKLSVANFSTKVYAQNKVAFSGGISKEIVFVTEKDLADAQEVSKKELETSGKAELLDLIKKNELTVFDESIKSEIVSVSNTKNVNDEAESFDCIIKLKLYGLAFAEKDSKEAIQKSIETKIGAEKMLINPDKMTIAYTHEATDFDAGTVKVKAEVETRTGSKIAENDIKTKIKNKKKSVAEQIIKDNFGVEEATINIWPSFLGQPQS